MERGPIRDTGDYEPGVGVVGASLFLGSYVVIVGGTILAAALGWCT